MAGSAPGDRGTPANGAIVGDAANHYSVPMKPGLRLYLVLLLILSLPLKGLAGIELPAPPCPMQAAGLATQVEAPGDCCLDGQTSALSEMPCKPGQDCKSGSLYQLVRIKFNLPTPTAERIAAYRDDALLSQTPAGVWRPPRT